MLPGSELPHQISVFLGLSTFYETVPHSKLIESSVELGFPQSLLLLALTAFIGPRILVADGLVSPSVSASELSALKGIWNSRKRHKLRIAHKQHTCKMPLKVSAQGEDVPWMMRDTPPHVRATPWSTLLDSR